MPLPSHRPDEDYEDFIARLNRHFNDWVWREWLDAYEDFIAR
jgi:hypothetical protein